MPESSMTGVGVHICVQEASCVLELAALVPHARARLGGQFATAVPVSNAHARLGGLSATNSTACSHVLAGGPCA